MELMPNWEILLLWVSGLSLLSVLATLVAIPWVVVRLPADYFNQPDRLLWRESSPQPILATVIGLLKNLLGLVLIMLGLIMLLTPGQGILTLLIGLLLMNFPGKYHVEQWLVLRPGVLRGLNWLRERRGHQPFDAPQRGPGAAD